MSDESPRYSDTAMPVRTSSRFPTCLIDPSHPPTSRVLPCDWRLPGPHPYHISSDCVLIGVLPDCLWIMR
jgi:hypothetical protein